MDTQFASEAFQQFWQVSNPLPWTSLSLKKEPIYCAILWVEFLSHLGFHILILCAWLNAKVYKDLWRLNKPFLAFNIHISHLSGTSISFFTWSVKTSRKTIYTTRYFSSFQKWKCHLTFWNTAFLANSLDQHYLYY